MPSTANIRAGLTAQEEQTTDPGALIQIRNIKLKRLRDDFDGRFDRLNKSGIDAKRGEQLAADWQQEYDLAKDAIDGPQARLALANRMVRKGEMLPQTALDVGRHTMGLPSAPRAGMGGTFSPTQMGYPSYDIMAEDMQAEGLDFDGGYNPKLMKRQYAKYKRDTFYSQRGVAQKQALDAIWEQGFYDPESLRQWRNQEKNDPDLFKTHGSSMLEAAKAKATGQKPSRPSGRGVKVEGSERYAPWGQKGVSPLSRSVAQSIRANYGGIGAGMGRFTPLRQAQQVPEQMPEQAVQGQLPVVTNDADFDAIPSGTEFIGPDGVKRRKP